MSFLENMPTRNAANFTSMLSGEASAGGTSRNQTASGRREYLALNDTRPPEGQVIGMCQGHSVLGFNWHQQQLPQPATKEGPKRSVPPVGGEGSNGNPWTESRSDPPAVGIPKPGKKIYSQGYGGGGGRSSPQAASHGAASSNSPAARGGRSTADDRNHTDNDDVNVPDSFAYSASRRENVSVRDGSGGVEGATRTHAVADAAAATETLERRSTRRVEAVASAAAVVNEATGGTARTRVDGRESRATSVAAEGTESVNSMGCRLGGRGLGGVSQARNLGGGAGVGSTAAGRERRVPLDGGGENCDTAVVTTTRARVGMRKARRTYGR